MEISLKFLRAVNLMTKTEHAKEVGCSVTTISNWEKGKRIPTTANIKKLAMVFNLPPQVIFNCFVD